jgi:L-malate glycosyltransferase
MTWRGGERQVLQLIHELNHAGISNILVCRTGSEISIRAEKHGIEVITLPLAGEWDVSSAIRLRTLLKSRHVDIVHAHTSHAHTIAYIAVLGLRSHLVVSRRVDFHLHSFFSRHIKYGSGVDRIITVSDAIRRVLVEDGVDPERVVTVRSGFIRGEFHDCEHDGRLRAQFGIPDTAPVIVTVAALAPHKSHGVLLKAAHLVIKRHPDAVFLFAGEGETRSVIERDIRNLGLENTVRLLGFLPDVENVYRVADVFAISSAEEGLCSSILDAMFFRLPVVATNAGGIPELVHDGVNGYVVPVNDYRLFAERLMELIGDDDLRKRMGMRSGPILERNSIERTAEETLSVYRDVLAKG